jgi:hypothetical protein
MTSSSETDNCPVTTFYKPNNLQLKNVQKDTHSQGRSIETRVVSDVAHVGLNVLTATTPAKRQDLDPAS